MDVMRMMLTGANALASLGVEHSSKHVAVGFSKAEWDLLTQADLWTPSDRRKVRSILAEAVNASLTIAGLPAVPLPAQYVAAVIATIVAVPNRLSAAMRAPEAYDAVAASGLVGPVEVEPVRIETMMALVMGYTSEQFVDPDTGRPLTLEQETLLRESASA